MKKFLAVLSALPIVFCAVACELLGIGGGGDGNGKYSEAYEPITGKFYLYETTDARLTVGETYFDIDGSKGNFSLKYYEDGVLKKEGIFQRVVTREQDVGKWTDNLHFNVKCGDTYEHLGTYTESFDPINQFRILEEYNGAKDYKYYYSETPFVLGTYVREGEEYVPESKNTNKTDYTVPTLENYTAELDGEYRLDEDHYFYFVSPKGFALADGAYMDSYFQYYSSDLEKPIEGFAHGITYKDSIAPSRLYLTYSHGSSYYRALKDSESALFFGYHTFVNDRMIDHYGSIDFTNGELRSFAFEHLSRSWTDKEWDRYTKDESYHLPDAIIYEYKGGEYVKVGR